MCLLKVTSYFCLVSFFDEYAGQEVTLLYVEKAVVLICTYIVPLVLLIVIICS